MTFVAVSTWVAPDTGVRAVTCGTFAEPGFFTTASTK